MFTCNVGGSLFEALSLRPEFHVALFVLGGMVRYVPALYVKLLTTYAQFTPITSVLNDVHRIWLSYTK
jgi:hypothetical protein